MKNLLLAFILTGICSTTFAADLKPKCQSLAQALADQITGVKGTKLQNTDIYLVDQNGGEPLVQVELYLNSEKKLLIFTTFGAKVNYIRDSNGLYVAVPNPSGACTAERAPGT